TSPKTPKLDAACLATDSSAGGIMPFDVQTTCSSLTGAVLNLYVSSAKSTPRGVIQVNHGIAEHAARYGRFAEAMSDAGFHVYAHDHRGHGATTAPDAPPGIFA